ncbi:hypothetical protein ACFPJ4_13080 [Lysinimonas soli]|uniref:DUF1624 domain-containing protein n=1 Tax=Lysinimonas soli TaxID=1074233 RepID=A0ABW0NRJ4_9MICO
MSAGFRDAPLSASEDGSSAVAPTRDLAVDRLRGALVILMVGGDYLAGVQVIPAFLKHAPDVGFTVADTVASAFVFVVGVNYGPSFARRLGMGGGRSYRHFLLRYLALIGIGALIAAGSTTVAGAPGDWGVLQALGVAGLTCLIVIRFPTWIRFVVGALILCVYQYALDTSMLAVVLHSVHGGLFGAVAWAALLILSTAVADVWRAGLRPYAICCAVLVVVATVSALLVPVSKNRVSLSFVLITLAISALVFLAVELGSRAVPNGVGVLCWWGESALGLYLLHLVILAAVVVPTTGWWYVGATFWLAAIQLVVILALMTLVAWWLHRQRLTIKL